MDAFKQNLENVKSKGKDYYDKMMNQAGDSGSNYTGQAKDKADDIMNKAKDHTKDTIPESKGDH
ncbi:hypothetical protein BO70DRAFT_361078 [Aspergillus heteromorphus CBS 117.55]|uniref:Uncharacterized protein n=1 Tax=Aspergillus heteromorphus CBS 117.55 TaxID=1448321 RepID=A0A317WIF7_9EURO|nr:uncharacterized protein BO70DRAFT_361078 [Aspergillus heteromorphus CBS 117.55]PWY86246.1 hypothetical protein BO70DRAFT_361078 [Aspergillus heteromorphus CBS 117.55]